MGGTFPLTLIILIILIILILPIILIFSHGRSILFRTDSGKLGNDYLVATRMKSEG